MPKALLFDTFGTVVDWRGSLIAEYSAWGKAKGLSVPPREDFDERPRAIAARRDRKDLGAT